MNKRYLELDSLRGLAALFVLFYHCLRIFPTFDTPDFSTDSSNGFIIALLNTPLRLFWAGHESVILFFILSGFVLSLPYYRKKTIDYKTYIIKRSFRIYIPYFVATTIAVITYSLISPNGISVYSDWFNRIWTSNDSFLDILNHILFLGYYNANQYNTVIWSLVHEMRISIIFPLIMWLVLKYDWKKNIVIGMILSVISFVILKTVVPKYNTDFAITLHYISMFMFGAILAKNIDVIVDYYKGLTKFKKMILFAIAILSYTYQGLLPELKFIHKFLINEYAIVTGSLLFIIIALSSGTFSKFLNLRPILFLGKISYSLYLYHAIILFSLIYIFNESIPITAILILTIISSIIISSISYYLVEEPSIKLGKKILTKNPKDTLKKTG